jgi:SpoVK/Ycf46/Vps4 family AAA+-type ATPase
MGDQEMGIIRGLKNVCQSRQFNGGKVEGEKKMNKHILIVSRNSDVPDDLKELTTVVEWNLPSSPWILAEVTRLIIQLDKKICSTRRAEERSAANTEVKKDKEAKLKKAAGMVCPLVPEDAPALTRAFQGMTGAEISTAFKQCSVRIGSERTEDSIERFISFVNESKKQIIKKSGSGLEVYDAKVDESDIGGLPILKDWLRRRTPAFTDEARAFGIDAPKGLLLIGIPGCGKSLTAKAAASIWNLPLLRLDMGTIFRGIVGSSEAAIRDAIRTAEAMAPCVLWMDEAEKSLSGTGSSDMSDAGTTARVFATILTWLEEKTSPVFVIMTANDISKLPPELIRKGRLDDMFFVDLPNEGEREEILRIHLSKRNHDPAKFDLTQLVQDTADYSGSELESAIVDALASVFYERSIGAKNRDLTGEDILKSLHETVPLSLTMREKVRALKTWARTRARFATESVVDKQKLTEKMRAKKLELDEEEDDLDVDMDGTEDCPALG